MLQINKSHARCVGEQRARAEDANGGGGGRQQQQQQQSLAGQFSTHMQRERA